MRYFLFFLCFFLFYVSHAKNPIGVSYNSDSCICNIDSTTISLALDSIPKITDESFKACGYHCIGVYYYRKNDYWTAIKYYEKAIEIRERISDKDLQKSYGNIGFCYRHIDHYSKALRYFEKIDESYKDAQVYRYIAECHSALGEYEKAKYNSLKSIKEASGYDKCQGYNTRCVIFVNFKDSLKAAINYADKAITCFEDDAQKNKYSNDLEIGDVYNNKGNALRWSGEYKTSIETYKKAIKIYIDEKSKLGWAKALNNLGTALYGQYKYQEAIDTLHNSLSLKRTYYENTPFKPTYAANHENLGENYEALNSIDKALNHYQLALQNLTKNSPKKDVFKNPSLSDTIYNKLDLIRVLHLKASAAFKKYKQTDDITYLKLAEKTYNTAFDFHDQLPQQINTQESRLFQAEVIVPFIENALAVAYELQQSQEKKPKTAFRFMEKNKATVLIQAINEADALQYAGLPDSLVQQEKELRESITAYEKQHYNTQQNKEKHRITNLLSKQKDEHYQLVEYLENNHPEYYNLKHKQNTTTLKDAQNYLDNQTAILEYFVGDSSIYVLTIEKDTARLDSLDKPKNWNKTLKDFRRFISEDSTQLSFVPHAHQLYQWLLKKPLNNLNPNIKHLQIIPDAQLNYLPFGLLIDNIPENPDYQNLPYLLKEKSISYAYSTTLLLENQQQKRSEASYLYGGFAPQYSDNDLNYGRENVEAQAQKFKGKSFLAKQATKAQFLKSADQFQILHLSMHGILDDKNPLYSKLEFTDEPLHAADLYNTRLNADLAILSACNTATGNIKKGEGVMSLSRAFTYAGCPSLLMSLWEVPDKETADIMEDFLEQLKAGKTKDEALKNAQLACLAKSSTTQHPMYWAGFVPSGNMQPVKFSQTCNCWWILALILIIISYFTIKRIRKPSKT